MSETSTTDNVKSQKAKIRGFVRKLLNEKSPSGYTLTVPDDGVMYVSDGYKQQHERWYLVVRPDPPSVADTRHQEIQEILQDVERTMTRKFGKTVYLMSALPVV